MGGSHQHEGEVVELSTRDEEGGEENEEAMDEDEEEGQRTASCPII